MSKGVCTSVAVCNSCNVFFLVNYTPLLIIMHAAPILLQLHLSHATLHVTNTLCMRWLAANSQHMYMCVCVCVCVCVHYNVLNVSPTRE